MQKKWKCTICGYIHEGDEAPEKCPICKADKSKFIELINEKLKNDDKWNCTVCGYIHTGVEPPEECPVCSAKKDKFVKLSIENKTEKNKNLTHDMSTVSPDEKAALASFKLNKSIDLYDIIINQIQKHHLHPISVHFPNGIIPVSFAFIILAMLFTSKSIADAVFYNSIFVVMAMPAVLFSGYVEWKNKYKGHITNIFITKLICGIIVLITSIISIVWNFFVPDIIYSFSLNSVLFLIVNLIMLIAAGTAGHMGGKLVFK